MNKAWSHFIILTLLAMLTACSRADQGQSPDSASPGNPLSPSGMRKEPILASNGGVVIGNDKINLLSLQVSDPFHHTDVRVCFETEEAAAAQQLDLIESIEAADLVGTQSLLPVQSAESADPYLLRIAERAETKGLRDVAERIRAGRQALVLSVRQGTSVYGNGRCSLVSVMSRKVDLSGLPSGLSTHVVYFDTRLLNHEQIGVASQAALLLKEVFMLRIPLRSAEQILEAEAAAKEVLLALMAADDTFDAQVVRTRFEFLKSLEFDF